MHLALLAVQVAFSTLPVEGKLAMGPAHGVAPAALAMARIAGAALVFGAMAPFLPGERVRRLRDVLTLGALALLGIVLNQALFLEGLKKTSPLAATVLVGAIPVFTAAISVLLGRERLTARLAGGLGLAVLGMLTLSRFHLPTLGDRLVILNALSYALYLALAQPTLRRFGTLRVMAWVFGLAALMFAPYAGADLVRGAALWSPTAMALVLFLVLVPTIFAYAANAWALARATPTEVTAYIFLQPLVVAVLSFVQLGQPVEPRLLGAGVIILAGVAIVARR